MDAQLGTELRGRAHEVGNMGNLLLYALCAPLKSINRSSSLRLNEFERHVRYDATGSAPASNNLSCIFAQCGVIGKRTKLSNDLRPNQKLAAT